MADKSRDRRDAKSPPMGHKDPSSWSPKALANYQRARSGPVTITKADGSTRTVSALASSRAHSASHKARKRRKRKAAR